MKTDNNTILSGLINYLTEQEAKISKNVEMSKMAIANIPGECTRSKEVIERAIVHDSAQAAAFRRITRHVQRYAQTLNINLKSCKTA